MDHNYKQVISSAILAANRPVLDGYSRFFGRKIFRIAVTDVFDSYDSDVEKGINTLRRCPKLFVAKGFDVLNIKLISLGDNNDLRIQFNEDPDLRFPLYTPNHEEPTYETVKKAIENLATPNNGDIIWFTDLTKLQKELDSRNRITKEFLANFAQMCIDAQNSVETAMAIEREEAENYAREMKGIEYPKNESFKSRNSIEIDVQVKA